MLCSHRDVCLCAMMPTAASAPRPNSSTHRLGFVLPVLHAQTSHAIELSQVARKSEATRLGLTSDQYIIRSDWRTSQCQFGTDAARLNGVLAVEFDHRYSRAANARAILR